MYGITHLQDRYIIKFYESYKYFNPLPEIIKLLLGKYNYLYEKQNIKSN